MRWISFGIASTVLLCGWVLSTAAQPADQAPAPANAAAWQPLFAAERWYREQAGEERVFRGKLEVIPQGPHQASTLMRAAYYKLGDRTLYTGAQKRPELDRLAGQDVEIRGKAVDMFLEGVNVREIWPAAVRPATP